MNRKQLKRLLNGTQELTVRDFFRISKLLSLENIVMESATTADSPSASVNSIQIVEEAQDWNPKSLENHTEQLILYGFALGCDMLLICATDQLSQSNIPQKVLERFSPRMPIQLDAKYHQFNHPTYTKEGVSIRLSFDALYTCFFPWSSIEQIIFKPVCADEEEPPEPPQLRLV